MELVERYSPLMLRIALGYVRSRAVAEDVVQDAWLGLLTSLDRFEGRSSLKTWILRILVNQARTRAQRERRSVPFSSLAPEDDEAPATDPSRFVALDDPRRPGAWTAPPRDWPEERLLARETMDVVHAAADALPARQREVFVLRDVEGWGPAEVSEALSISDGNQRVLLHRARSKVRSALEDYFAEPGGAAA